LLVILVDLKVARLQVAYGAMFERTQSNANTWIHGLLAVLHQTLEDLGAMPVVIRKHFVAACGTARRQD
jgi:hypothetical protein